MHKEGKSYECGVGKTAAGQEVQNAKITNHREHREHRENAKKCIKREKAMSAGWGKPLLGKRFKMRRLLTTENTEKMQKSAG